MMSHSTPLDTVTFREDLMDLPMAGDSAAASNPSEPDPAAGDGPRFDPLPSGPPPREPPSREPLRGERTSPSRMPPPPPRRRRRGWALALLLLGLVALTGAAVAGWMLKPAPAVLAPAVPMVDFQDVRLGTGEEREITVSNRGQAVLTMTRTDLGGADAADFAVTRDGCSGRQLARGETCGLLVAFHPTARGRRAATLALEGDASNAPQTIPLLGQGTAPELTVVPEAVAFEPLLLGNSAPPITVRVANRGTSQMAVGEVVVEGLGAGDFSYRAGRCQSRTLAPGRECTITVTFLPTVEGERRATLRLRGDGEVDGVSVALVGEGLRPEPRLRLGEERLNLGVVAVGEPGPSASLAIANDGDAPLVLDAIDLEGPDSARFTIDPSRCLEAPIPAGGGCTVDVAAAPPTTGQMAASLFIRHAGGLGEVPLRAVGVAPQVRLEPLRIGLGEVPLDRSSRPASLRVENVGMAPLRLGPVAFADGDRAAFSLADDSCSGRTVASGEACTVQVTLTPRRPGPLRTTLVIPHNAGREQVPVTGFGVAGRLVADLDTLTFDPTLVGRSRQRRVVLRNAGQAALRVRPPRVAGAGGQAFEITESSCSRPLAAGGSCAVSVTFEPAAAGTQRGQLVIEHDGDGARVVVALAGESTLPPKARVAVRPSSIDFGSLPIGGRSEIETVTLTNVGNASLDLTGARIAGAHPDDFRVVPGSCAGLSFLAAGATCTIGVRFTPSAEAQREGRLELAHRGDGTRTIGLIGSGLATAPAFPQ